MCGPTHSSMAAAVSTPQVRELSVLVRVVETKLAETRSNREKVQGCRTSGTPVAHVLCAARSGPTLPAPLCGKRPRAGAVAIDHTVAALCAVRRQVFALVQKVRRLVIPLDQVGLHRTEDPVPL